MSDLLDDSINPKPNSSQVRRTDFGNRLAAHLLDSFFSILLMFIVILTLTGFDIAALIDFVESLDNSSATGQSLPFVVNMLWIIMATTILYASLEAFTGASLGKRLIGIQIGTQDAKTAPTSTYVLRSLVKNFSIVFSALHIITGLSLFSILQDNFSVALLVSCLFALGADRLALHDKLLGTAVYKKFDIDKPA